MFWVAAATCASCCIWMRGATQALTLLTSSRGKSSTFGAVWREEHACAMLT